MNVVIRAATQALRRLSFTFAADGSHAACLASAADGGWYAESWRLPATGPAVPTALALPGNRSEHLRSQLVALPDGSVLVGRHDGERHELVKLTAAPPGAEPATREIPLATFRRPGLRLLPLPSDAPAGPGAPVAVALGSDTRPATTVWLVHGDGREPRQVAEVPGLHGGGVWLDRTGALLALDRVADGIVRSVVLDLRSGAVTPLLEIGERSNDRLALFDPDSRFAMVRSDAPGSDRLGWGVLGGGEPLRFPNACTWRACSCARWRCGRPRTGSASRSRSTTAPAPRSRSGGPPPDASTRCRCRPGGSARSRTGRTRRCGCRTPLPTIRRPWPAWTWTRCWRTDRPPPSPDRPRCPCSWPRSAPACPAPGGTPSCPGSPAVPAPRTAPPGWQLDGSTQPGDGGRWHPAQSLELAGPAGPLEAVVYGGEAWLSSPHLVLALHGGPADAWRLEFDPALQRMAAEGLAVVAPNQRGSTGYGVAHAMAIRGSWGGPDLDDILYLLDGIAGQRAALGLEPPALFGVSYGAFLALLAAAHAPTEHVARCAVVAPFLSGARLLAEAAAPVRALTTRLGGGEPIADARGPRDVLQLAHRLSAPLLVVHGDRDEVVPVSQSRSLRHELLRIGRTEGADFRYVEAAGSGHEVLAEDGAAVLHELLAAFLRTGRPG
ncbi:alpha/beta hydrolase family protein [Kitasatospora aburaviensis]